MLRDATALAEQHFIRMALERASGDTVAAAGLLGVGPQSLRRPDDRKSDTPNTSPAFGQVDLTNCERELIHLAGSVQPHGVLLAVRELPPEVVQASANVVELLRRQSGELLERLAART